MRKIALKICWDEDKKSGSQEDNQASNFGCPHFFFLVAEDARMLEFCYPAGGRSGLGLSCRGDRHKVGGGSLDHDLSLLSLVLFNTKAHIPPQVVFVLATQRE